MHLTSAEQEPSADDNTNMLYRKYSYKSPKVSLSAAKNPAAVIFAAVMIIFLANATHHAAKEYRV